MTGKLMLVVMAQEPPAPFVTDENGEEFVSVPDVCGSSWWAMIHGWAEAVRDAGCSTCGQHAVQFVSAMHDLVNVKLMAEGDKAKRVHDPENFMSVARRYHEAVHAADLECNICNEPERFKPADQLEMDSAAALDDVLESRREQPSNEQIQVVG
jgi:hypothetical protein